MQSWEQYQVALSFAGEQRCYVESVARELQSSEVDPIEAPYLSA